jgi:hypothetical protein
LLLAESNLFANLVEQVIKQQRDGLAASPSRMTISKRKMVKIPSHGRCGNTAMSTTTVPMAME